LLTTHNLERAVGWADSVTLLAGGKIAQTAAAATLTTTTVREWLAVTGSQP
jgi:ABC-type sulfate/molybdate transport systems ATPase subunit